MRLDKETRAEVSRLATEMAGVARSGPALPGTLTQRHTRCGREGCRCGADPPQLHGPYWSWTRKVNNKTVTRYLSDQEVADYERFFDNAKRLRTLLAEARGPRPFRDRRHRRRPPEVGRNHPVTLNQPVWPPPP